MADLIKNRFTQYFAPLLNALRSTDPVPMSPAAARAWIRSSVEVPAEDLTRRITNSTQSIFENQIHWARFYLAKAGLIGSPRRGLWGLTDEGRGTHLTAEETWNLYARIRDSNRLPARGGEDDVPAPDSAGRGDEGVAYWFVGTVWNKNDDQMPRFLEDGVWENGYKASYSDHVRRMKPGDRIAVRSSFSRRYELPFDFGGKPAPGMCIKRTGTVLENSGDGRSVKVAWDPPVEPRYWYFYIYVAPVSEADTESESARRLIDFTFRGAAQEYAWFLAQPYWVEKHGAPSGAGISTTDEVTASGDADDLETEAEPTYGVEDIVAEGCFLQANALTDILERWRSKKNLVLQGPPGTGKTWLAKRLGFALVGSNDRETTRSRLRVVQFHPSLAYEDFVRGWRPEGDGKLALVDGILMQAIEAASSEPDKPFVLVIEEINRGNPAQIFGEMLTLLEDSKRRSSEGVELAYRRAPGERVYIPANLYVIGTMNIADRSLAIVDLALRRRFAFIDLEPQLGPSWHSWCGKRGLDEVVLAEIETRISALNVEITASVSLGPQFRIGHSYVTPDVEETIIDSLVWFRAKVETEIGPLLDEYWYDVPETARAARAKLLAQFV
jgi:5-methylcytosine-specific restriction protein B